MYGKRTAFFFGISLLLACAADTGVGGPDVDPADAPPLGPAGKGDSAWVSSNAFEVDAMLRSTVARAPEGQWTDLATSPELQHTLVDKQLKFVKNEAHDNGYFANQLFDRVQVVDVREEDGRVVVEYEAVFGMLHALRAGAEVPSLEELRVARFDVTLPMDPIDVHRQPGGGDACISRGESGSDRNYFYYWSPDREGCEVERRSARVEVVEVFGRPTVYPEYDRLLRPQEDGTVGFRAAIVPAYGDSDSSGRFENHRRMIEDQLGLVGERAEDHVRYRWRDGDTQMVIDLFDPTEVHYERSFVAALGSYQLVWYNGHSNYGTRDFLLDEEAYDDEYQIIGLHSCRSYPYYVHQAFRAKATPEDPQGFDGLDFVATGESSYASGSPKTLRVLLQSLMDGIVAVQEGRPEAAPDWITIADGMNRAVWQNVYYGIAGVRTNAWQPSE